MKVYQYSISTDPAGTGLLFTNLKKAYGKLSSKLPGKAQSYGTVAARIKQDGVYTFRYPGLMGGELSISIWQRNVL